MKLSIIIVHYKTYELTKRCVQSIIDAVFNGKEFEIIIVDNDSNDGAGEKIKRDYPVVNWIYNTKNEGFGRANNLGVSFAKGEYLLFLNSDIIVPLGTIDKCLDFASKHPKIGVLGPKLLNEDGTIQKSTYCYIGDHQEILKENLLLDKLFTFVAPEISALMGSFMIIPRALFLKVRGFDPDFFMYCEELDLCGRIKELNYEILYLPSEVAIHKHGGSSSNSNWVLRQKYLSRSLLTFKRKGIFGYFTSHSIYHFNFITNIFLMWFLDKNYRTNFLNAYKAYFANWLKYWMIPFRYKRSMGNGVKLLRSA